MASIIKSKKTKIGKGRNNHPSSPDKEDDALSIYEDTNGIVHFPPEPIVYGAPERMGIDFLTVRLSEKYSNYPFVPELTQKLQITFLLGVFASSGPAFVTEFNELEAVIRQVADSSSIPKRILKQILIIVGDIFYIAIRSLRNTLAFDNLDPRVATPLKMLAINMRNIVRKNLIANAVPRAKCGKDPFDIDGFNTQLALVQQHLPKTMSYYDDILFTRFKLIANPILRFIV